MFFEGFGSHVGVIFDKIRGLGSLWRAVWVLEANIGATTAAIRSHTLGTNIVWELFLIHFGHFPHLFLKVLLGMHFLQKMRPRETQTSQFGGS